MNEEEMLMFEENSINAQLNSQNFTINDDDKPMVSFVPTENHQTEEKKLGSKDLQKNAKVSAGKENLELKLKKNAMKQKSASSKMEDMMPHLENEDDFGGFEDNKREPSNNIYD